MNQAIVVLNIELNEKKFINSQLMK